MRGTEVILYEDSRQQVHDGDKHALKHEWWAAHGIQVERRALPYGDYMRDGSNVTVDTKRNVAEIAQNICGKNHDRFRRECQRASADGYRLVVLVENVHGYESPADAIGWVNAHCRACRLYKKYECNPGTTPKCERHGTKPPAQGPQVAAAMVTMSRKYGVMFEFCTPDDAGKTVCELLGVAYDDKGD